MQRPAILAVTAFLMAGPTSASRGQDPSPGGRRLAGMVYDAARREVVLFGGYRAGTSADARDYPNDLFAWTGSTWRRLEPRGGERPRGREVPHVAYDAARRRVVMFGGRREASGQPTEILSDVWEWDGVRWHALENTGLPKVLHAMTSYDPVRQRVVAYGGLGDDGFFRTLWEWDGSRWSVRDTAGPAGVIAGAAVVSPAGDVTIMATTPSGDRDPVPDASTTWKWNGTRWVQAERGPPFASLQATASAPNGTLYFYQVSERWLTEPTMHVRSPEGVWTSIRSPPSPGLYGAAAAFDAGRNRFVLHGGGRAGQWFIDETWEFDGDAWTKR